MYTVVYAHIIQMIWGYDVAACLFFKSIMITSSIIQIARLYLEIHEYVYTYTNAYNNNEKEIVNLNESKKKVDERVWREENENDVVML